MVLSELERQLAAAGVTSVAGGIRFKGEALPDTSLNPDAPDVLPSRARGDYREKTVHMILQDAIEEPAKRDATKFLGEGFAAHPDIAADQRERFAAILRDHYVITTAGRRPTRLLFPFHSDLPANYTFNGRYKMFNGRILAFLAAPGSGDQFNTRLLDDFYSLFNGDEGLSLLDRQVRRLAEEQGAETGKHATAEVLLRTAALPDVPVAFPGAHRLFQRDLNTALALTTLGRRDKVNAVLTVLYLHIAIHYWRAAWCLEEQVQAFVRWMARPAPQQLRALTSAHVVEPEDSSFRGQLKFRVSSSHGRSISRNAPAAVAYREVDQQRLLRLPSNLTFVRIARELYRITGSRRDGAPSLLEIAQGLEGEGRETFDLLARAIAHHAAETVAADSRADLARRALSEPSGAAALRGAIESVNRKQLRRLGRDITAQVMKRGGKGLVATRGPVTFFELGPELLVLLTTLLAPAERTPYREFLTRLGDYGLAPQNRDETDYLANVMRSMQLLEKHSDAGEAMYVSHLL